MADLNVNSIADEAGTGAPDFTAMPSVAGDPVVESGSNSDGEWTRFADGTQLANIYNFGSGIVTVTWTYPVPFISDPGVSGGAEAGDATTSVRLVGTTNTLATSVDLYVVDNLGDDHSPPRQAHAIGRWK